MAVSTLTHDQMVDLLKTSASVMVTVIPPLPDGSPRRGCNLHNCKYTLANYEGDYENVQGPSESATKVFASPYQILRSLIKNFYIDLRIAVRKKGSKLATSREPQKEIRKEFFASEIE